MPDRRAFIRSLLSLRDAKESGVVTVRTAAGTTFVYLRDGVPIFAEEGTSGETLGRMLLRQKVITQHQYVDVLSKMTDVLVLNEQLRFGEVAVELGYLTEAQASAALADQVRWKIIRILQRPDLEWSYEPSLARLEDVGHYPMQIEALVLEAVRWIDDDEKADMGLRAAAEQRPSVDEKTAERLARRFKLTKEEERYLRTIDGRTIRSLLDEGHPAIDVHAVLTALVATRALELARPDRPATSGAPRSPQSAATSSPPATRPAAPTSAEPPARPSVEPLARPRTPLAAFAPAAAKPRTPEPPLARPRTPASPAPAAARARAPAPSDPLLVAAPPAAPAPRRALPTRASTLLKALAAQRIEPSANRAPASEHEAKLLSETALQTGLEHARAGRYEQALPHLQRALQLMPHSDEYKLYAKWCALRARSNELPHKVERAELDRLAHAALKTDPNFAFGSYVSGEMALHEGDDGRARRLFKHALKLDPSLLDAQRQLRIVERRLNDGAEKKKLW
jgi:tetratricopeptide (TPR) repeat protein